MTRTQSLLAGSESDGRDRHVNNCWEEIRALERPARGTVGIQVGGAGFCLGGGKARIGTHFQSSSQVPRSGHRCKN